jgi:hypothetical protein
MSDMQAFHKWLFSKGGTPNARRQALSKLARATRAQVLNVASELIWYIWGADPAASA